MPLLTKHSKSDKIRGLLKNKERKEMGKVPLQTSDVWRCSVILATRGDREHGTSTGKLLTSQENSWPFRYHWRELQKCWALGFPVCQGTTFFPTLPIKKSWVGRNSCGTGISGIHFSFENFPCKGLKNSWKWVAVLILVRLHCKCCSREV